MEAKPRKLEIYQTKAGTEPFSEWLDGLKDGKGRGVIQVRLNRIAQGNFGDCKSLGEGVYELRIDFGPGYRVYFGLDGDELVILLAGGDKKSQASDIQEAKDYWSNYNAKTD